MAFVLRRPGTQCQQELEDTGIIVHYRYPDNQAAAEIQRQMMLGAKQPERMTDVLRAIFGLILISLENVDIDGESTYTFETDKANRLTEDSLAPVLPVSQRLLRMIMELLDIGASDRKN